MSNCQDKDLNLALDLVHPHQDSALNHISWHQKEERKLNFQIECYNFNSRGKGGKKTEHKNHHEHHPSALENHEHLMWKLLWYSESSNQSISEKNCNLKLKLVPKHVPVKWILDSFKSFSYISNCDITWSFIENSQ